MTSCCTLTSFCPGSGSTALEPAAWAPINVHLIFYRMQTSKLGQASRLLAVSFLSLGAVAGLMPPAAAADSIVSDQEVHAVVGAIRDKLLAAYPFPDIAQRYADQLPQAESAGHYRQLDHCTLARQLTEDLRSIHKDVHLRVICEGGAARSAPAKPVAGEAATGTPGFESVEQDSATSTVYIRSKGGWHVSDSTFDAATRAMAVAANAQHVIIDVRGNPGGSGEIGRFLASYFYPTGEEKYYLYGFTKNPAHNQQEWTYAFVPGRRLPDAKLYILVDKDTASATEGFAFAMQHLKRATIIGEVTAGAGIAGAFEKVGSNLTMFLPTKMIVAPNTNEGWEGKGVQPDVVTAPGEERAAAMALIARH